MEAFLAGDVEKITGVPVIRLHDWMRGGFVAPTGRVAHGRGFRNLYSKDDVFKIALFSQLTEIGLHRRAAKNALSFPFDLLYAAHWDALSKDGPGLQLAILLRCADGAVEVLHNISEAVPESINAPGPLADRIRWMFDKKGYDFVVMVNLSKLFNEVDAKIQMLAGRER